MASRWQPALAVRLAPRGVVTPRSALVLVCLLAALVTPSVAFAQKTILLVRHGERADDTADAALSPAGEARARKLADLLKDAGVTAIFATQFERTLNTAKPLADKLGVAITRLKDTESAELVASLRTTHRNDVVLVVAHSHTIPEILKLLGHAPVVTIGASEFDNLFAIVPRGRNTPPTVVRLRY